MLNEYIIKLDIRLAEPNKELLHMGKNSKLLGIACGMIKDGLMAVGIPSLRFELLEQGLQRMPDKKYEVL